MSDPVDTDALRKIGRYAAWIARQDGEGALVTAAADEVDRLRAVIENAPHEHYCGLYFVDMDGVQEDNPDGVCDCWKADAL